MMPYVEQFRPRIPNFISGKKNKNVQDYEIILPETNIVEYVWIDGDYNLRSKTRVLSKIVNDIKDIPEWNYDGSSTNQAHTELSEVLLKPVRLFKCPFRRMNGYLVMCCAYDVDELAAKANNRDNAEKIFRLYESHQPWYGLEQEYFIFDKTTNNPIGFYEGCAKQGQYYCSVGASNAYGRQIAEQHLENCLFAGITISGINAEVAPGQWEFQIGPVSGIDAADQLWMARYILERITENYGVYIVYHPKPLPGDWNGSGCHINFSTCHTRSDGGLDEIYNMIKKLKMKHADHMIVYGDDNEMRMSGVHETSKYHEFSYGIANRSASIRIPKDTAANGKGYFEDRRPAANIDPYLATSKILETVCQS